METFKIEVQELLSRTIDIKAQNIEEAIVKANQMYNSEEIVLDYNDLSKQEIIPNNLIDEKDNLTKDIIEYLYQEEKRHFEELEEPQNHIFLKLERLKILVD
jgi:hypothetical protein